MRPACRAAVLFALAFVPIRAADKFEVERFALRQFEDGPALPASHEFLPGETVYWSFRLRGFHINKGEDESRVKLSWHLRVTDSAGVLIEKEKSGKMDTRVFEEDKDWTPRAAESFLIPPFAAKGIYHVTVTAKDEPDGAEATAKLDFNVRGDTVEPSNTLIARDVRFLRGENDQKPMTAPAYPQGGVLWVRFDITGYKFGEKNKFDVEYGLTILKPTGDVAFTQPVAAKETNESFYPQHYVPGLLSLSLDPTVPKGTYTLVITIRDKIGNQTWESREKFQIE